MEMTLKRNGNNEQICIKKDLAIRFELIGQINS